MPFVKGDDRINKNGRPKGSKGVVSNKIKDAYGALLENNLEQITKDLESLKPLDRLKVIIDLSKYVVPTLKSQDIQVDNLQDGQVNAMSEEVLDEILRGLKESK